MPLLNNLGTRLFQSVTDKAGDIGEKFEEEFSRLSYNITAEVDLVVMEILSLSLFIKITLVLLCVLIVVVTLRYLAFGARVAFYKLRDWLKENSEKQPPQVILLMPQKEASTPTLDSPQDGKDPNGISPLSPLSITSSTVPFRQPHKSSEFRSGRPGPILFADPVTTQNIENIRRESMALFHNI